MGYDGTVVLAAAEVVEIRAEFPEVVLEFGQLEGLKLSAGLYSEAPHAFVRLSPNTPDFGYGKVLDEGGDCCGADHEEAVWLVPVGCDFGNELVGGDSRGGGETGGIVDALLELFSDFGSGAGLVTDIEVGLV